MDKAPTPVCIGLGTNMGDREANLRDPYVGETAKQWQGANGYSPIEDNTEDAADVIESAAKEAQA